MRVLAQQGWLTGDPLVRFLLLISAMIWPGLSGINGTASSARLIVYPLGVTALPLWFADGRMKTRLHGRFPWQADLLITLPWPIDLIGNRSNLFDTVSWWDDALRSNCRRHTPTPSAHSSPG